MCFIRIEQHKHSDCQSSTGESLYISLSRSISLSHCLILPSLSISNTISFYLSYSLSVSPSPVLSLPQYLFVLHTVRDTDPFVPAAGVNLSLLRAALALAVLPPYLALLARGWSSLVLSVRSPLTSLSTSPHCVSSPHCWAPHTKHRLIQTITVRSARKSDTFSNVKINPMFNC